MKLLDKSHPFDSLPGAVDPDVAAPDVPSGPVEAGTRVAALPPTGSRSVGVDPVAPRTDVAVFSVAADRALQIVRTPDPDPAAPADGPVVGTEPEPARMSQAARRRGKKTVKFTWLEPDRIALERVYLGELVGAYASLRAAAGHDGTQYLSLSNLIGHAFERALPTIDEWAETIVNDRRRAPVDQTPVQVGLVWPLPLVARLDSEWTAQRLNRSWPVGFKLTKSHLVLAAVQAQLPTVMDWLVEVPNDDRFTPLAPDDRRLLPRRERAHPGGPAHA